MMVTPKKGGSATKQADQLGKVFVAMGFMQKFNAWLQARWKCMCTSGL